ncbi:MAG: NAD-dependent epimerase/dehydratase family protein [Candidatus Dormibacteria bacterium]
MRVAVTGGAGFIGSHLSDRLLADGHQVVVIDDLSSGRREQVSPEASFHRLSVTSEWLPRVVRRERPEVIYHLAAQIDVRASVSDPLRDASVNVLGTVRLLEAAVRAGVRRLVFVSSGGAIYGDTQLLPTPETHPLRPDSPYGAAKAAGEAYLSAFANSFGLETAVLRPGNVYGPRQDPRGEAGVIAIFAGMLLTGNAPLINGDGLQTRDYVFVDDVVEAALVLLDGPLGQYNIGTGRESSVLEVAQALAQAVSTLRPGSILPPPRHGPGRAGEQRRSCLDCALAKSRLGWAARVDLSEGISRTAGYFAGGSTAYL